MPQTYVVLDIETTGLNAERDAIIEIGAVKFSGSEILESWSSLVNPRRELSRKIQRLTGIGQEELDGAPSMFEISKPLVNLIGSHTLIGHNVAFDVKFLNRQGLLMGHSALDTFEMASILLPEAPRYSLGLLAEMLGITQETQHRALADAMTTHKLFLALWERAQKVDPAFIHEINRAAAQTAWPLRDLFRDVEQEQTRTAFTSATRRKPSLDGDLAEPLAGPTRRQESLKPAAKSEPIDVAALMEMVSPGGLFEQRFPGYEFRPQQVEMLETVAEAFNNQEHLLVEAGTGTGKSLAYLLPAIYFAQQNGEHVVISTNTINLQDQLYGKDIPDLQKLLPFEFNAAMLKGRSNYLCRRRLNSFRRNTNFTIDQARVLAKLLCWLPQTAAGDRAELVLIPSENGAWAQVQAEAETCLAERCIYRQRGQCFLYRARHAAEAAHVIIINHALLLSDMVTENRVLPEYDYLIVDEAHHLEESATDQLGFSADQWQLGRFLGELSRQEAGVGRYSGFLTELLSRLREGGLAQSIYQEIAGRALQCHDQVAYAQTALKALFAELAIFLDNFREQAQNRTDYDLTIRLTHALRSQPDWTGVEMLWDDLAKPLGKLEQGLSQVAQAAKELEGLEIPQYEELMQETLGHLTRLREMSAQLEAILTNPTNSGIYWAQVRAQDGMIALHMAPLHVAPLLQTSLFARKKCAVLTSATLCSAEGFDYIRERLGLEDANEKKVGSPFDYKASTLIYAPADIPEPGQPNYQRAVERALVQLALATKGRMLVLFTSNSQLQNTYRAITPELEEEGIVVYAQGLDGARRQILESFKNTPQSVLLGTRSFWEGVDVVGSALSCLVVVRLPFSVPSDPIFAARSETFDEPFAQYAVPEAILRFRQGFGRLIRTTTDRGVVVILDKRLLSKSYGASFMRALPRCTTRQGTLKDLPLVAARWIDKS
jgi:DNA polymerase-3 subunit epsilon/ATP-dependent DNA helicase DinG